VGKGKGLSPWTRTSQATALYLSRDGHRGIFVRVWSPNREPDDDDEMIVLRTLVAKSPDADLLRGMISFAAHRLMELEVEGLTGAGNGERSPIGSTNAMAIVSATGGRVPARWNCASPRKGATSRLSWSLGG
jgi:hypothetical protein